MNYVLGYFFNDFISPGYSDSSFLSHKILTKNAFESQIEFLEKDLLKDFYLHYDIGGIGNVMKSILFKIENQSSDMRMKRASGALGFKPVFPIYDAEICEVIYNIPDKYFLFENGQRPKNPLRLAAKNKLKVPEFILEEKKSSKHKSNINPNTIIYNKIKTDVDDYMKEKSYMNLLEDKFFKIENIKKIQFEDFTDIPQFLLLEFIAKNYL